MNSIPLTIERCKELHKKGLYFKKSCPGLSAGWKYYKIKEVDETKKTILIEPMDSTFCPNWNPFGRAKYRIEDVFEIAKDPKRRNGKNKDKKRRSSTSKSEQEKKKKRSSPMNEEPKKKKKRRRNT